MDTCPCNVISVHQISNFGGWLCLWKLRFDEQSLFSTQHLPWAAYHKTDTTCFASWSLVAIMCWQTSCGKMCNFLDYLEPLVYFLQNQPPSEIRMPRGQLFVLLIFTINRTPWRSKLLPATCRSWVTSAMQLPGKLPDQSQHVLFGRD